MLLYAVVEQYIDGSDLDNPIQNVNVRGLFTDQNAAYQHLEDGVDPEQWKCVKIKDGYREYEGRYYNDCTALSRCVRGVRTDMMYNFDHGMFPFIQ